MKRFFMLILLYFGLFNLINAQKSDIDTMPVKKLIPRKATIYSAVCPGLGQIYNGKIWKAGIIYAGFAGIGAGFVYNQKEYKSYQEAVNLRFDTLDNTIDNKYPNLNDATVKYLRDYHRRNRDICILAFVGLYALNIIDANVDAHLQEFKINKDLSLAWQPNFTLTPNQGLRSGIHLKLTF
jgi:TM2 domain-containing membrane protein YozV